MFFKLMASQLIFSVASSCMAEEIAEKESIKGFPFAILCNSAFTDETEVKPNPKDTVRCTIQKSSEVVFNESITWENSSNKGYFFDVTNDVTVNVSAVWPGGVNTTSMFIREVKPMEHNCTIVDQMNIFTTRVGGSELLGCEAPETLSGEISEEKFNEIEVVWYKDCNRIKKTDPLYSFQDGSFGGYRGFSALRIHNATFEDTPGNYQCVVNYKGAVAQIESYRLCVQDPYEYVRADIVPHSREYFPVVGEDLEVGCSGRGSKQDQVLWKKAGSEDALCIYDEECSYNPVYNRFCKPATEDEIESAKHKKIRTYSAVFNFRNVTYEDSGVYECTLANVGEWVTANFTVTVKEPHKRNLHILAVCLAVVGAIVVILLVTIAIKSFMKRKRQKRSSKEVLRNGTPIVTDTSGF